MKIAKIIQVTVSCKKLRNSHNNNVVIAKIIQVTVSCKKLRNSHNNNVVAIP